MHCITKSRPNLWLPVKSHKVVVLQNNANFSCLLYNKANKEINLIKSATRREISTPTCSQCAGRSSAKFTKLLEYSTGAPGNSYSIHRAFSKNISGKMAPIFAPTVKLNNGYEMPVLGLGTYELKKNKCENAVREALKIGYRHIDTAYLYRNEAIIGRILQEQIDLTQIKREDIFLATKLWSIYHEPHMVKYACKKQLEALKVDYIDLYLMHNPIGYKYVDDEALMPHEEDKLQTNDIDFVETYKAMEELVSLGWVRSLGLSNFSISQMQRILDGCSIKPVTNQVECHPALNQHELREFCGQHDIIVTSYSPLARPKSTKPLAEFYGSEEIQKIAEKYQKTKAQIVLRYLIDIGTAPIPKSARPERLLENIDIFDFHLTQEEISIMNGLNANLRLWPMQIAKFHQYWPFIEN